MAALGTFIAGRYTGIYASSDLGILEEGWRLRWQWLKEMIEKTDAYGDTPIDAIFRGCSVWIGGIFKEINVGVYKAVSRYNDWTPTGTPSFDLFNATTGPIGTLDTSKVVTLVLSVVTGTPAASTPASLTAAAAIQDTDQIEQMWGPTHRKTPFNFRLYPYVSTTTKFFSCT